MGYANTNYQASFPSAQTRKVVNTPRIPVINKAQTLSIPRLWDSFVVGFI